LNKNLISVEVLEVQDLSETLGEGVLNMFSGLLVVLKRIWCHNLYYLKGSIITENLAASEHFDDDFPRLWQMRLGQVGMDSLQALAK